MVSREIQCPKCHSIDLDVIFVPAVGSKDKPRLKCMECGHKFVRSLRGY